MSILKKLPAPLNVAASSTALINRIPLGPTYDSIILQLGGTTFDASHISAIRVLLDNKLIWNITGPHLQDINDYMAFTANAAYVEIPFKDVNARTINGMMVGGLDTSLDYKTFDIEVDIGAATAPTLDAFAQISPPKPAPGPGEIDVRPIFRALLKSVHTPNAAAEFDLPIPIGSQAGALIKQVHFFHSNITQIDVKKDGLYLQDKGTNAIVQYVQNRATRTTQAGLIVFDPVVDDVQSQAISTVRPDGRKATFEWLATLSGADTVTAYSDVYTTLRNL